MLQTCRVNLRSYPRMYFPLKNRVVDTRISQDGYETEAQVTFRRKLLRSEVDTGVIRQTEAPLWSVVQRPTHFLSLRFPAQCSVRHNAAQLTEAVRFSNRSFATVMTPLSKLHVTVAVLTLQNDDLSTVEQVLNPILGKVSPIELTFRGLGTFSHGRVLVARICAEGGFMQLNSVVHTTRMALAHANVDVKGNPHDTYVPHVTLAKIKPDQQKMFGSSIPTSLWAPFRFHDFGVVKFDTIDLCHMSTDVNTGYYNVVKTFKLL